MPKFIVDECTGMAVVHFLRAQGFDVISVSELMPQAIDSDILKLALAQQRVVITNDKDFGDMVFRDSRPHAGILLLRLPDDHIETKVHVLAAVLVQHCDKLENNFVVATKEQIRLRSQR